jgi:hypothetical protein
MIKPTTNIKKLSSSDVGQWVEYSNGFKTEKGKIKRFDNERQVAWIVYNANENWDGDHWKDYTAACTDYYNLTLLENK